jgi:hypothetical protein
MSETTQDGPYSAIIASPASFEVEEEAFDEALGLLDHLPSDHTDFEEETEQGRRRSMSAWWWWIVTILLVALWSHYLNKKASEHPAPLFTCPLEKHAKLPENVQHLEQFYVDDFEYEKGGKRLNLTEFVSGDFRTSVYDHWGHTYDETKANLLDWKVHYFAPYLADGSSIFESACGIGLNLYLTLELLQEEAGIEHVVVYGNAYVEASTKTANQLFDRLPPAHAPKGRLCTGDSTDLSYIPSDSFDLVYTGYIR